MKKLGCMRRLASLMELDSTGITVRQWEAELGVGFVSVIVFGGKEKDGAVGDQ